MRTTALALLFFALLSPAVQAQAITETKVYLRQPGSEAAVQVTVQNPYNTPLKDVCVEVRLYPAGGGAPRTFQERVGTLAPFKEKTVRVYTGLSGARTANGQIVGSDGVTWRVVPDVATGATAAAAPPPTTSRPAAAARAQLRLADVRLRTPSSGGSITVVGRVRNDGDAAGSAEVSCYVRDASQKQLFSGHKVVQVPAGATVDVEFPTRFASRTVLDTSSTTFLADTDIYGAPTHSSILKVEMTLR